MPRLHAGRSFASSLTVNQVIEAQEFSLPAGGETTEVRYSSDAQYYAGGFEHLMQFGPGDIALAHSDHESIAVAELRAAIETLARLTEELTDER